MVDQAQAEDAFWQRILVLAPLGRDAEVLCRLLADNALVGLACRDSHELVARMDEGFAAVLIAEESLTGVRILLSPAEVVRFSNRCLPSDYAIHPPSGRPDASTRR